MEWNHIQANRDNNCPNFAFFVQLLVVRGYSPYNLAGKKALNLTGAHENIENVANNIKLHL